MENQEQLLLILNETATEIEAKLDAERPPRQPSNHFLNNWASEYHHPCRKMLTHCRVDWKEREVMSIDGRWRVEEGSNKEWQVKKWLGDVGFQIIKDQFYYSTEDPGMENYKHLHISGKIDGMVDLPSGEYPIEIKSISPHYWDSTRTIEDITRHPKFWINKIPSQLNTYFVFAKKAGGFLVTCTFGKKPRILPMLFDQELWEYDQRTAEEVNKHVAAGTYPPPIPYDPDACSMCDFNHLCQPLKARNNLIEITEGETIELGMYCDAEDECKKITKRRDELKAKLIGKEEKPGRYFGKEGRIDEYEITSAIQKRQRIQEDKKDEVKTLTEPFREPYDLTITKIRRIGK